MARRVLIVDDSPQIREAFGHLFSREADFQVCGEAENGWDAIEKAKELHPDLIVTDFAMPVMNGLEETQLLKQLIPTMHVIMCSIHSDPFIEKHALAAGVSAFVPKSQAATILIHEARALFQKMAS